MNSIFRLLSVFILVFWAGYWKLRASQSKKEKPEIARKRTFIYLLSKYGSWVLDAFVLIQLAGYSFLPIHLGPSGQIIGIILVCIGFLIAVFARISLDSNWSNAFEYQIKKKHELITRGVYQYIRHPIYTGMILAGTGAELVAESYVFIPVFVVMSIWAYTQAKKEERILSTHFGKSYQEYINKSWMFFPSII